MNLKQLYQNFRRGFHRYINGRKGVISLFLAFSLSPLLGTTLVLEEYARYQNVVELMGEITGSSALSTLANFDKYMEKRFGLMSISQENSDISALFNQYYKPNLNIIGDSATSTKASASGKFPLSNVTVLRQQILENAELSVPTEFMFTGFNVGEWEKQIAKKYDMKEQLDLAKAGEAMLALSRSLVKYGKSVKALVEENEKYQKAMDAYNTAAKEFNAACDVLAKLKARQAQLASNPKTAAAAAAMEPEIQAQKQVVMQMRNIYIPTIDPYKKEVEFVRDKITAMMDSLAEVTKKNEEVRKGVNGGRDAQGNAAEAETSFTDKLYEQITRITSKYESGEYKTRMGNDATALKDQKVLLQNFTAESVGLVWVPGDYAAVQVYLTSPDLLNIVALQKSLNSQAELTETSAKPLSEFLDILEKLQKLQGFYDPAFNSIVNGSDMYLPTSMSAASKVGVDSLNHMIKACRSLMDTVQSSGLLNKFIRLMEALVEFFIAFVEFVVSVFAWLIEVIEKFIGVVADLPNFYDNLLLYGYAGYNLPNRTNGKSGKTLYGYDYSKLFHAARGVEGTSLAGTLDDFRDGKLGSGAESMPLFKGAELEYMLVGGNNEVENQVAAFYDTYMFRMALDAVPILKSGEVKAMATASSLLAWVVYILIIIFEPLIDTFVLVNGGFEYLYKETLYLTPSGIGAFSKDVQDIVGISKDMGEKLEGKMGEIISVDGKVKSEGKSGKQGIFKMKYAEHGILLLMIRTDPTTYMNRLRNIIYMETKYEHRDKFKFDLDKSYTMITTDTEYRMNPLLKLPSLTGGGPFVVRKERDYFY